MGNSANTKSELKKTSQEKSKDKLLVLIGNQQSSNQDPDGRSQLKISEKRDAQTSLVCLLDQEDDKIFQDPVVKFLNVPDTVPFQAPNYKYQAPDAKISDASVAKISDAPDAKISDAPDAKIQDAPDAQISQTIEDTSQKPIPKQSNITSQVSKKIFGNIEDYQIIETLIVGKSFVVYRGIHEETELVVSLKKIQLDIMSGGFNSTTMREVSTLRQIDHPNVVKLIDLIMLPSKMYLVTEYLEVDMQKKILNLGSGNSFARPIIKSYLYQLISGVAACHSCRIIHRDLKPSNILVGQNNEIKIADFNVARSYGVAVRPYTRDVTTLQYRAPELLLGATEYSSPVDMWSCGCIFAEIISKRCLFDGESEHDQIRKIFKIKGTPNEEIWPGVHNFDGFNKVHWTQHKPQDLRNIIKRIESIDDNGIDLLEKLLIYDPTQRISAFEALQHPYFADVQR